MPQKSSFIRHAGVIISVCALMLTCILRLDCSQEAVAGEGLPWFRRFVRNAITDNPTLRGSFINTGGSPSRSAAIISHSQRAPSSQPSPSHLPYSSKQYDNPNTFIYLPSLSIPLSCLLPIWLYEDTGSSLQLTRPRLASRNVTCDTTAARWMQKVRFAVPGWP